MRPALVLFAVTFDEAFEIADDISSQLPKVLTNLLQVFYDLEFIVFVLL